ncbi:AI-2E family transporter [Arenimonas sp. GDDSR-1]|uniref:AI-2E family transporter n=1 Tax=Arenimonas sp. GDDSR-1 TaxID=2950125 RepID=UPI0026235028|nr:AI-2E family transporter [Arenimonas sp. GDDSR-1]
MIPLKWQFPLLLTLLCAAVWLLSPILSPFIFSLVLAWMGLPLVRRFERWGLKHDNAVLLALAVLFGGLILGLLILIPLLWMQLSSLVDGVPRFLVWVREAALPWLAHHLRIDVVNFSDREHFEAWIEPYKKDIGNAAANVIAYLTQSSAAILGFLSNMLLVPLITFYFLRDWHLILAKLHQAIPRPYEATVARLSRESNSVLGGFIDGQFRVMLCLGALYAGGLWLVGIDSALLIGFLSGALNFVPYMGFVVGIVLAAIASIIQFGDVQHLIWVGVVYGIGQFTESFILTPRIVGDRIGLNPVMVIFVLMAGGLLFGFLGILLALPVSAVLNVVFKYLYEERYLKSRMYAAEPAPPSADPPPRPDV